MCYWSYSHAIYQQKTGTALTFWFFLFFFLKNNFFFSTGVVAAMQSLFAIAHRDFRLEKNRQASCIWRFNAVFKRKHLLLLVDTKKKPGNLSISWAELNKKISKPTIFSLRKTYFFILLQQNLESGHVFLFEQIYAKSVFRCFSCHK